MAGMQNDIKKNGNSMLITFTEWERTEKKKYVIDLHVYCNCVWDVSLLVVRIHKHQRHCSVSTNDKLAECVILLCVPESTEK